MILTAWRIFKSKYAAHAFNGEGARQMGGRWNSKGNRIVYAAEHLSLAVLEMLVNLDKSNLLPSYSVSSVHFDDTLVESLEVAGLPSNWREYPFPMELPRIGDAWLAGMSSVILEVPNVLTEIESNYLINLQHPDFASLSIDPARPFTFDFRRLSTSVK